MEGGRIAHLCLEIPDGSFLRFHRFFQGPDPGIGIVHLLGQEQHDFLEIVQETIVAWVTEGRRRRRGAAGVSQAAVGVLVGWVVIAGVATVMGMGAVQRCGSRSASKADRPRKPQQGSNCTLGAAASRGWHRFVSFRLVFVLGYQSFSSGVLSSIQSERNQSS